jgi:TOBE domain
VFEGTVLHTSFVGGQWRTLITLDEMRPMQVLAFPDFQPQIEQRLWLEMPPERCQIVPE